MKRTVLVNISMRNTIRQTVYRSEDPSLPASERQVSYPVLAFLEAVLQSDDHITCILIVKESPHSDSEQRIQAFQEQMQVICTQSEAEVQYHIIHSAFTEQADIHEQLMDELVSHIEPGVPLIADITYGPKDLPIVVFASLNFAERFLDCSIERILYGQGIFDDKENLIETRICDMSPLYTLHHLTNTLQCQDPQQAKELLHAIVTL